MRADGARWCDGKGTIDDPGGSGQGGQMADNDKRPNFGGAGGIWFLGFIGALVFYIHTHSGTFWLVVLAVMKSVVWPAFVVFHILGLK
jgi:hypothetical protein